MKRIVVCFDGTWSKPADEDLAADQRVETNVCRFYESVRERDANGTQQVKWYDEGVGAHWYDRYIGAAIGATRFGNEIIDESVTRRRKQDRDYEPQNNGLPTILEP